MSSVDLSQASMFDLFRVEAEAQTQILTAGLLALERNPNAAEQLEACMRAAHSLKGAARIVDINAGVSVAHAMEDCFVAAQQGHISLRQHHIDELLRGVDLLLRIAHTPELELSRWDGTKGHEIKAFASALLKTMHSSQVTATPAPDNLAAATHAPLRDVSLQSASAAAKTQESRVLRVTSDNLNRLLGLAGESLVESRWLKPFSASLLRLKRQHYGLSSALEQLREALTKQGLEESALALLNEARQRAIECQQQLSQRLTDIESFDRRATHLSHRLYEGALACRMRPFADDAQAFPRMVRDLARTLGKQARLEITGAETEVDRDILEKLEAPLGHLLRNALDHGIEAPGERIAAGKSAEGVVRIEARHSAGRLQIIVSDDGRGIDLERLRSVIVARNLASSETAATLSEAELLEFLFLPGFTLKESVTEISGRGVGLDAVQDMLRQVRGTVRVMTTLGQGVRFQLELPLTLSVLRALLVEVGGEPYAVPLVYLLRTLRVPDNSIERLEGRAHIEFNGRRIGLVSAQQILGTGSSTRTPGDERAVIVLGSQSDAYGVIVDRFLGERELVVQPLDARLGKVQDIAAGALMEDGSPVLILDVEDLLRSVEKLAATGHLSGIEREANSGAANKRKRVLVVDDSFTVRELERKLLEGSGYEVEVAVDGMDGWNAVRTGRFDLVVTDVDMPRMNGIELVTLLKQDPHVRSLPVMIVSYKDRPEDRSRGLEAGADYYLAKGSFHDEKLLQAVADLIGVGAA